MDLTKGRSKARYGKGVRQGEWNFVLKIMKKIGFNEEFIKLIQRCINTRLLALLTKAQQDECIKGVKASVRGPIITHILYADDSIIFLKNSIQEAQKRKDFFTLTNSLRARRLTLINIESTSTRTQTRLIEDIRQIFRVKESEGSGTYLGLHLVVGKGKIPIFNFIKDKTVKCIKGWSKNIFAFRGIDIFLKSVAQALPMYVISYYLLWEGIIEDITRQIHTFWWSGKYDKRGWAMVAWDKDCAKTMRVLQISGLNEDIINWQGSSGKKWLEWILTKMDTEGFFKLLILTKVVRSGFMTRSYKKTKMW
ncbi:uncharacterized protein LOC120172972 [Hibiscus syriacus]|uniref:uncharacterized protein LOC120172972 n=1 Tax=Hibiscus syriacus TaxID=106335 RepID=UPI00192411A1|nr:uncharacterized protein LOC120172972 [Hibiscus syriacus]